MNILRLDVMSQEIREPMAPSLVPGVEMTSCDLVIQEKNNCLAVTHKTGPPRYYPLYYPLLRVLPYFAFRSGVPRIADVTTNYGLSAIIIS